MAKHYRRHALGRWLRGKSQPHYGFDAINVDAAALHKAHPKPYFVAGYDTGGWPWSPQDWALFPFSKRVHIVTTATADEGDVLDVENGDASPDQVEGWLKLRKAAGYYKPTVYCSLDNVIAVRKGAGAYVLGKDYDIWCADWTGKPHEVISSAPGMVTAACVITQWADGNMEGTPDWDYDVLYDAAWPRRKAPVRKPGPPVRHEADGTISLVDLAAKRNTTPRHIADVSMLHLAPGNDLAFMNYVLDGTDKVMPKGLVYYTQEAA